MAWNQRKDSRESKAERRRGGASVRIAALAAVAVLCAAGGVWWWASCGDVVCRPVQPAQSKGPAAIPEAKPAAAPEPAETNAAPQAPRRERLPPGTKRHVTWKRPDNWDQLTRAQKTRIQPVARVIKPVGWDDRKLFSTPSDRRLERLMRVKPGQLVLGTLTYNEKFVSDFLESLKTPIEFEAEDTEGDKAIKQAVIDARADLKAAYDRGEDIVEIMNRTEKELHELAAYRIDLRKQVVDYYKSGEHAEQDVKDYISAANTILKRNGMEPLRLGELWFRKSQYDARTDTQQNGGK